MRTGSSPAGDKNRKKGKEEKKATRRMAISLQEADHRKTLRLSRLVQEFLEQSLQKENLLAHPDRIDGLRKLLLEDLWDSRLDPFDPNWVFDAGIDDPDEPGKVLTLEDIDAGADTLLFFHRLLKGFWDGFKDQIGSFKEDLDNRGDTRLDGVKDFLSHRGMSEYWPMYTNAAFMERTSLHEVSLPMSAKVRCTLNGEKLHFFSGSVEAVHAFINLLSGVSVNALGKCRDETCGRWFVRTSRHRREFCNRNCAARWKQAEIRKIDREGFNDRHREYYRKYCSSSRGRKTNKPDALPKRSLPNE